MAGYAALRGGAGLVTVATPDVVLPIVAAAHAEYMTEPLAATEAGTASRRNIGDTPAGPQATPRMSPAVFARLMKETKFRFARNPKGKSGFPVGPPRGMDPQTPES